MATWEYLKTADDSNLDELGQEGWELVGMLATGVGREVSFYFKRQAPGFRERVTEDQKRRYYTLMGVSPVETRDEAR